MFSHLGTKAEIYANFGFQRHFFKENDRLSLQRNVLRL